jgi:membrane-associated phospholipid phosphatase
MRNLSPRVLGNVVRIVCTFGAFVVLVGARADAHPQEAGKPEPAITPKVKEQPSQDHPRKYSSSAKDPDDDTIEPGHRYIKDLPKDFLIDQKHIWTSPARLRFSDIDWLVPVSGIAAGLFVTDSDVSRHISNNPSTVSRYKSISTDTVGVLIGGSAAMWGLSYATHNEHWRETGLLAGEAAIGSLIPVELMKYSLRRQRPYQGDGTGPFFQGGTSFPSEHAAAAWAIAGVLAHEYPGTVPKLMFYSLASLVSYSRIQGRQHFSSDVFIGSLIGQLVAQNVYKRHHDPSLGGEEWRSIGEVLRGDGYSSPANRGSPYVPLDSWIYPALDRLMARGAIDSGFSGMRPWTRLECARLVSEAGDQLENTGAAEEDTFRLLEREFNEELDDIDGRREFRARVESVYARATGISGQPLTNGYIFGQTIINDYGRPYEEGFNAIAGFSAWTTYGRWVGYVRAEYQHAPSAPALSLATRTAIANIALPIVPSIPPATPTPSVNQIQLLDAYTGINVGNFQITFGQESHWWGPGNGGPMMFSDNAVPIKMFRIDRVSPFKLPSILGWLGPMRVEFFLGQLAGEQFLLSPAGFIGQFGQAYNPQPIIHGQKVSFKPTPNLEFSLSRTVIYGGPGYPLTLHTFLRSMFSTGNENPGSATKPGDRRSAVDLSYRIPGLRRWLTFYADGFTDDQFSPVAYADRSVWRAGLYFPQVPLLPKLDLRFEGTYSDNPLGGRICCGFFYYNATWRAGYTNDGNLIGSWIGRDGQGAQAWANYWFTPKNRIQASYRHQKVSNQLLPGGGTLTDAGVQADVWTSSELSFSAKLQYETWNFPVIRTGQQSDVNAFLQLTFWPSRWRFQKSENLF